MWRGSGGEGEDVDPALGVPGGDDLDVPVPVQVGHRHGPGCGLLSVNHYLQKPNNNWTVFNNVI